MTKIKTILNHITYYSKTSVLYYPRFGGQNLVRLTFLKYSQTSIICAYILLTKTTAARNADTLSYQRVRG